MTTIEAIGPSQINVLGPSASGTPIVTVTYPVGSSTVLSVQPDGSISTRPQGTAGAYERAILKGDRLIYESAEPNQRHGKMFIIPYAPESPNP